MSLERLVRGFRNRLWVTLSVILAASAVSLGAAGCTKEPAKPADDASKPTTITVTDLAGRTVAIEAPVQRVCAIGPGALRLVCYAGAADKVVGIEQMEKQWGSGRPYILANRQLLDLPVIGQGGPDSSPDPEALLSVEPHVIFASYLLDASKAAELQEKTGIPVVVLSYGKMGTFDKEILDSLRLIGRITGNDEHAEQTAAFIEECQKDLAQRTAGIADAARPRIYAGAVSFKGSHGIESSQAKFPPFDVVRARNVVDETGKSGSVMVEREKLLAWDPDYIFIDQGGLKLVLEDKAQNPDFYESLTAVREGRVYAYLPYNFYMTNVDTALADAYFIGSVLYPDAFEGIDPVKKAGEIYEKMLGQNVYEQMAKDFGGFKKLEL